MKKIRHQLANWDLSIVSVGHTLAGAGLVGDKENPAGEDTLVEGS